MGLTLGFWKHERFMDVAVMVTEILQDNDEFMELKVFWVTKDLRSRVTPNAQNIKIKRDDFRYWTKIKGFKRRKLF